MTKEKKTETMITQENSKEAEEIIDFFKMLNAYEQHEFISIIRGARLVKNMQEENQVATA